MNIFPIHTEQDCKDALKSVSPLFDNEPEPATPEGDYLEVMITLIEAYEAKHFQIDLPNPSVQDGEIWAINSGSCARYR